MKKASLILASVLIFVAVFGTGVQAQRRVSSHAKGAVIGGLGGAAAGALINKRNRVVGGAVGGVAGAGLGYAIGKNADNKRKAEAARVAAANRAESRRAAAYRAGIARGNALAATKARSSAAPAAAMALAAGTGAGVMYTLNNGQAYAPTASASANGYLPNENYGDRSSAYPSSEVRRKSW